jgi:hypothetical protein
VHHGDTIGACSTTTTSTSTTTTGSSTTTTTAAVVHGKSGLPHGNAGGHGKGHGN